MWESTALHLREKSLSLHLKTPLRSGVFHLLSCPCLPLAAWEEGRTAGKSAEKCRSQTANEVLFAKPAFGNVKRGE